MLALPKEEASAATYLGNHAKKAKEVKHRYIQISKRMAKPDRTYTRFLPAENIVVVTSDSILLATRTYTPTTHLLPITHTP